MGKEDEGLTDGDAAAAAAKAAAAAAAAAAGTGTQAGLTDEEKAAAATTAAAAAALAADQDWEKRFKGLQPKHQKLVEDHKSAQVTYGLDKQTWDTEKIEQGLKIDSLEGDLKKATESLEGLTKGNEELTSTVGSLETKLERNALIMGEYPDLAQLEAKGLIRQDLAGDELTTALNDLRSLMVAKGSAAAADLTAGSTGDQGHSSGSRGQAMSATDLNQKIMVAQKAGEYEEADRLTRLLIAEADATILNKS